MIKIKTITHRGLQQVLDLLDSQCHDVSDYKRLHQLQHLYVPFLWMSQLLPPSWQFMPAIYVATSREQILGVIRLNQDGAKANRWKIEEIIIDPHASTYDIGAQLIQYVINHYGGAGVQTFLSRVDHQQTEALGLLKSCGFRHCAQLHSYFHSEPASIPLESMNLKGLREAHSSDAQKLLSLHSDCLPAEARLSLERCQDDFSASLSGHIRQRLSGIVKKRWVLEDVARDVLVGMLEMETANNKDFHLTLWVNPGWCEQYESLLKFGIQQATNITKSAQITVETFDFYKTESPILQQCGFQNTASSSVLVKDYWIPLQDKHAHSSPILLLTGKPSPVVNMRGE